jgi:PAS domain S-box-containing protein
MSSSPKRGSWPGEVGRVPFYNRLSVQLMLAALLPILLVSLVIGVPLIDGRRAQLLAQEQLRAEQAAQNAELIYRERLAFAQLLARLLVDSPVLVQSLSDSDQAEMLDFVRQTRTDTLFDLVTVVDPAGRVLAQDGMVSLWRPEFARAPTPHFWGVPGIGLVVQVASPIMLDGIARATLIGSFLIDRALLSYVRAQTDLDQSMLFGGELIATSLASRTTTPLPTLGAVGSAARPLSMEMQIAGAPYLVHYLPLKTTDARPMGVVEVLLPLTPVRNAQNQATLLLLFGTLVVATIAVALAWYLARRVTGSIHELGEAALAIGNGALEQPIIGRGPAEIRLLSTALDQMQHRLAESRTALQAEKARYANILESVEEAVIVLDSNGHVTSLNRSAEVLLGWERVAAIGEELATVVRRDDEQPLRLTHIPPIGAVQLAIRTQHGERVLVAATRSIVLGEDGAAASEHVVVLRDVSEEEAVRQLKDAFLANVTHEFRTPLAALIASLEILRDEHETMSADEHRQLFGALQVGVQRLDILVQNLLDSASIQAGYFRVEPEIISLGPLVREAGQFVEPLLKQRRQSLVVTMPDQLSPVLADGQRIVQVLLNLISNASKFSPDDDRIVVAAKEEAGVVIVSVTDYGPGIAPTHQARLFERFLRPGAETVQAQGAGLGLAIVKAIIERHGGEVHVHSAHEETTFSFTLPIAHDGLSKCPAVSSRAMAKSFPGGAQRAPRRGNGWRSPLSLDLRSDAPAR